VGSDHLCGVAANAHNFTTAAAAFTQERPALCRAGSSSAGCSLEKSPLCWRKRSSYVQWKDVQQNEANRSLLSELSPDRLRIASLNVNNVLVQRTESGFRPMAVQLENLPHERSANSSGPGIAITGILNHTHDSPSLTRWASTEDFGATLVQRRR